MKFNTFYFCKSCAYFDTNSKVCDTCSHYISYYNAKKETYDYKKILNRKHNNEEK